MQLIRNFICFSGVIKVPVQCQTMTVELTGRAVEAPNYHQEAEWPLIIYTVSLQSAVGTLLGGLLQSGMMQLHWEYTLVTLALGIIGMLGAVGHLASPLRAPRAILNWRRSWLSREIALSSIFMGLVAAEGAISLLPLIINIGTIISPWINGLLGILAGVTGIALLGAMSMIYLVPTRPVWNHSDTLVSFYTGALPIGLAVSAAIAAVRLPSLRLETSGLFAVLLIMFTILRLKIVSKVIERLNNLKLYQGQYWGWMNSHIRRIRIVLALAGGIAVPLLGSVLMLMPWFNQGAGPQVVWILAALLLIIGEGIDRWAFFRASPPVIFPPRFQAWIC